MSTSLRVSIIDLDVSLSTRVTLKGPEKDVVRVKIQKLSCYGLLADWGYAIPTDDSRSGNPPRVTILVLLGSTSVVKQNQYLAPT